MTMMKTCHDCRHSAEHAQGWLECHHHTHRGPCPDAACELFEREPGADACERDAHRVWYDDMPCTICGRTGHTAASCKLGAMRRAMGGGQ